MEIVEDYHRWQIGCVRFALFGNVRQILSKFFAVFVIHTVRTIDISGTLGRATGVTNRSRHLLESRNGLDCRVLAAARDQEFR